jgi:legumain
MKYLILLSLICFSLSAMFRSNLDERHHAVLVAGSNGIWNYRHQSDIFHAYHILVNNGMPKENIIVFAYDDIANDSGNPIKGKIFNKPDPKGPGFDVYAGVSIDYKGRDVTPQNFLSVIAGNAEAVKGKGTGRVLQSSENDHVFINFSDHGAPGLIAFPSEELFADDLIKTLKTMHEAKKYKQLVFYLEACESGSMFNKILKEDMNIYATTASSPNESSWATYCSPNDVIDGKSLGNCLGDEYSVNWMEDSDADKGLDESLATQFSNVKERTKHSGAHEYGDKSFVNNDIGQFQGNHNASLQRTVYSFFNKITNYFTPQDETYKKYLEEAKGSAVDSRYAKLKYLETKMKRTNNLKSRQEYQQELEAINRVDVIFSGFSDAFLLDPNQELPDIDFDCLRATLASYKQFCGWGEYELKYVKYMVKACHKGVHAEDMKLYYLKMCAM